MRDGLFFFEAAATSIPNTANTYTDFANVIDLGTIDSGSRFTVQHLAEGAEQQAYVCFMVGATWSTGTDGFTPYLKTNASASITSGVGTIVSMGAGGAVSPAAPVITNPVAGTIYKLPIPEGMLLRYLSAGVFVPVANSGGPYSNMYCWIETGANSIL